MAKEHHDNIPRSFSSFMFQNRIINYTTDKELFLTETCPICYEHMRSEAQLHDCRRNNNRTPSRPQQQRNKWINKTDWEFTTGLTQIRMPIRTGQPDNNPSQNARSIRIALFTPNEFQGSIYDTPRARNLEREFQSTNREYRNLADRYPQRPKPPQATPIDYGNNVKGLRTTINWKKGTQSSQNRHQYLQKHRKE
jgi:hypothetical protein